MPKATAGTEMAVTTGVGWASQPSDPAIPPTIKMLGTGVCARTAKGGGAFDM